MKIVRGVIRDSEDNVIIGTFPEIERTTSNNLSKLSYPVIGYHSYEVALLRVYYYNDSWHISTSRKLDAFQSNWALKISFGEQFQYLVEKISGEPLVEFFDSLDKSIGYFFLIPLVGAQRCGSKTNLNPQILWLSGVQKEGHINLEPSETGIWKFLPKITFNSAEEISNYLETKDEIEDTGVELTGIMICLEDKFLRVVKNDYLMRYNLRENESNIFKRYLELLKTNPEGAAIFAKQHKEDLELFDKSLEHLVEEVFTRYVERFIRKNYKILPKRVHTMIRACHGEYISDRSKQMTPERVWEIIFKTFPPRFILNTLETLAHSE